MVVKQILIDRGRTQTVCLHILFECDKICWQVLIIVITQAIKHSGRILYSIGKS